MSKCDSSPVTPIQGSLNAACSCFPDVSLRHCTSCFLDRPPCFTFLHFLRIPASPHWPLKRQIRGPPRPPTHDGQWWRGNGDPADEEEILPALFNWLRWEISPPHFLLPAGLQQRTPAATRRTKKGTAVNSILNATPEQRCVALNY